MRRERRSWNIPGGYREGQLDSCVEGELERRVGADGSHMNLSEVTVASTGSELNRAGDVA